MTITRGVRAATIALAVGAAVLTSANTCQPGTSNQPASTLFDLVNAKHLAAGCGPLTGDERLRVAAERHAVDMRDHPTTVATDPGHIGSDGSTIGQRISDAGYAASKYGEIMYYALGPPGNTPQATVDWWMNSPGHRAIIQDCDYTNAGVGLVYPGGTQWFATIDFGRP